MSEPEVHECVCGASFDNKGMQERMLSAEADANQLAGQLTSAMLCYHIMAKHGGSTDDCTAQTCRDYREALRLHKEHRAGD